MKRETYEIYISVGTEELKKMFEMYATNDIEIIKQTAKILVNVKCIYEDVNTEIIEIINRYYIFQLKKNKKEKTL